MLLIALLLLFLVVEAEDRVGVLQVGEVDCDLRADCCIPLDKVDVGLDAHSS